MLKHTLLLIYRNIRRYSGTFFINMVGLSTGLACAVLIYMWVNEERSVDRFHENGNQLVQVMQNQSRAEGIVTMEATPGILADALAEDVPEVAYAVPVISYWFSDEGIVVAGETRVKATEQYVGEAFFHVFSYPLIQGDKNRVLANKDQVLISDEMAHLLFKSSEEAIGKSVEWNRGDYTGIYTVSGVFEKPPSQSSEQFDLLFTYELFAAQKPWLTEWTNNDPFTFVRLREGVNVDQFSAKIADFIRTKHEESKSTLFARPYGDRYLYAGYINGQQSGGRIAYVRLFALVAIFTLIIACVNYVNLSTARASRRVKEVGIKKAIGAERKSLFLQYMSESLFMTILALVVALGLVWFFLPQFNQISGKQLQFVFDPAMIASISLIALLTGLISGCYPALYVSGFSPMAVLKGSMKTSGGKLLGRKGLVVFQFVVSIILIAAVVIVSKQLELIQTQQLGYDRANVIRFDVYEEDESEIEAFLTEITALAGVENASTFYHTLTGRHGRTSAVGWAGKESDERVYFANLEVGYDFIETMDIEMADGRSFSREFNSEGQIIFNEAAIAAMGIEDPLGQQISLWGDEKQIVGVAKNFNFESLYEKIEPSFLQLIPATSHILVKLTPATVQHTLSQIDDVYDAFNPGIAFEYRFIDEDYQALYESEMRVASLSRYFAGLAILISCLGLLGLAAFTTQRRFKEIAIRKTLGAHEMSIVSLLSKEFGKLVMLAMCIALPVSYIGAARWLEGFAYSIELKVWYFLAVGCVVLLVALLTVVTQTSKAVRINPVHILQYE